MSSIEIYIEINVIQCQFSVTTYLKAYLVNDTYNLH